MNEFIFWFYYCEELSCILCLEMPTGVNLLDQSLHGEFSGNEGSLMGWRLELKGKIWVMFTTLFLFQIAVFLGK